jgi:hypothetical protein
MGPATLGYFRHHAMQTSQYLTSRRQPEFHPGALRGTSIFYCRNQALIDEAAKSHVHHQAQSQKYKQRGRPAVTHERQRDSGDGH